MRRSYMGVVEYKSPISNERFPRPVLCPKNKKDIAFPLANKTE